MGDCVFDIPSYRERLQLFDAIHPTIDGLRSLQRAQLYAVPVENFDIQLGRGIELEPSKVFDKLVLRPRGGYCFELNGLFLMALHAFGFEARPLLGRVHLTGTPSGRGHQISLVEVDGREWIADVGFGKDTPLAPLLLEWDTIQEFHGQAFRLVDGREFGTMVQKNVKGEWINLYSFDMEHVCSADIAYGNHYTSTSPNSFFTTSRFAVKPFDRGWIVLFNYRLKLIQEQQEQIVGIPDGPEYLNVLKTHFGIDLAEPYESLRPVADDE